MRGGKGKAEVDGELPEGHDDVGGSLRLSKEVGKMRVGDEVDMRAVTLLMWKARARPELVSSVTEMLRDRHASKGVLKDVEFFLPQLVHMLVHVDVGEDVLQEFMLMVCQVSMHFALLTFWQLVGYLEDAQPELETGRKNPHANTDVYMRCSSLLYALERAVVYGDNVEVLELEDEFQKGRLDKTSLDARLRELRLSHAKLLVSYGREEEASLEGELLFKRSTRSNLFATKGWKTRRFAIQNRNLLCYRVRDGALKRAIPLYAATVVETEHRTHEWYFEIHEGTTGRVFKLAASDERTRAVWIKHLRKAMEHLPQIKVEDLAGAETTVQQTARHQFFRDEIDFVRRLTDISDGMMVHERTDRQAALKRDLLRLGKYLGSKTGVYVPLMASTEEFEGVVDVDPNAGRAFSTKERCPILLTFKVAGADADVATTLRARYGEGASHEETLGEKITHALLPALSRSPSSLWEEEEMVEAAPKLSKMVVPSATGLTRVIAKNNDDLRQEVFVMQLITFLRDLWEAEGLGLWLHPYRILSTSKMAGLIEVVEDSQSLDALKSGYHDTDKRNVTLEEHFQRVYESSADLAAARKAFTESMAGYSLMCYILGVHDRHNGNIMLRKDGRVVHIDYGFVFSMAPGKDKIKGTNFSLERAAFKLTNEMVEVMGGLEHENWQYFNELYTRGLLAAREHVDTMTSLIEISGYKSELPMFNQPNGGVTRVIRELRARLLLDMNESEVEAKCEAMILHAKQHRGTVLYEKFQQASQGIRPIF